MTVSIMLTPCQVTVGMASILVSRDLMPSVPMPSLDVLFADDVVAQMRGIDMPMVV